MLTKDEQIEQAQRRLLAAQEEELAALKANHDEYASIGDVMEQNLAEATRLLAENDALNKTLAELQAPLDVLHATTNRLRFELAALCGKLPS